MQSSPVERNELLTLQEAADYVRRSTRTLRRWVAHGELPGAVRVKQTLLVPRASLDAMFVPVVPQAEAA